MPERTTIIDIKKNEEQIKKICAEKARAFFTERKSATYADITDQIKRFEFEIDNVDPLGWLSRQQNSVKTYWSDREQNHETAAVGAADIVTGKTSVDYNDLFNRLKKPLGSQNSRLRYYGGISFNQGETPDESWLPFGVYRFIIPRFEIFCENQKTFFACNILYRSKDNADEKLQEILNELNVITFSGAVEDNTGPAPLARNNFPDFPQWERVVNSAVKSIRKGYFEKIVLARKAELEFQSKLSAFTVLKNIKKINPGLTFFCFQPADDVCFIGGTPELLYRRNGRNEIHSEAIGSTTRRGKTTAEDKLLKQELIASDKSRREHWFVLASVKNALADICSEVSQSSDVSVIKLARVQHLFAALDGILKDNISDGDIISALHPTPAVGGYPKEETVRQIEKLEPFCRGWYGGPVGWVAFDSAEFSVAIRSGLIKNNKLSLFSGAGIVTGSEPQAEWDELESKINNYLEPPRATDRQKTLRQHGS